MSWTREDYVEIAHMRSYLGSRVTNILLRMGINSLDSLASADLQDIADQRNCGDVAMRDICRFLESRPDLGRGETAVKRRQHEPIPDTYACQRCGRRDGLDAVAPNEIWRQLVDGVIGPAGEVYDGKWGILCLWCMDEIAAIRGLRCSVSLHFAGRALYGTSDSDANAEHVDKLVARIATLETLYRRLLDWDHLDGSGDGPYWRREINASRHTRSRSDGATASRASNSPGLSVSGSRLRVALRGGGAGRKRETRREAKDGRLVC